VHAEVPGRGGGPGYAGGRDPAEGRVVPESQGAAAAWGALELGRAGSRPTGWAGVEPWPGVALGRRDLDEAGEEQRSGSRRRQGRGTRIG
jgi:hypothetical protein